MVRGDLAEALDLVLGCPNDRDHGNVRRARQLYELGKYADAAQAWPGMFRDERRALKALQRTGGKKKRGFLAIDASLRKFYVSAYQSYLFNRVVAGRLRSDFHHVLPGDLAWLHANGAVFEVVDQAAEQPRVEAFEISATGPLFGYRMTPATGQPGKIEADLLAAEGLTPESFRAANLRIKGSRRPLRFRPTDALIRLGADAQGTYLELWVTLPRGCYATSLLRELFASPSATAEAAGGGFGTEQPLE